jgi:hypothetical protein
MEGGRDAGRVGGVECLRVYDLGGRMDEERRTVR